MSAVSRITYVSRPADTPEAELNILSACYRFIIDCHTNKGKEAARTEGPDDAVKGSKDDRTTPSKLEQP